MKIVLSPFGLYMVRVFAFSSAIYLMGWTRFEWRHLAVSLAIGAAFGGVIFWRQYALGREGKAGGTFDLAASLRSGAMFARVAWAFLVVRFLCWDAGQSPLAVFGAIVLIGVAFSGQAASGVEQRVG